MERRRLRARILGTGHFLPPQVRTNRDLERMLDTPDAWIVDRTGIRERRVASHETMTSDLAAAAAREALDMAGLRPVDLDLILLASVTPEMKTTPAAALVAQKLGADLCPAIDVSAARAEFVFALAVGEQSIRAGKHRRVLVLGADTMTKFIDWSDRRTCVLFGDGAGAVVLGVDRSIVSEGQWPGVLATSLSSGRSHDAVIPANGGAGVQTPSTSTADKGLHVVRSRGRTLLQHAAKKLVMATHAALEEARMPVAVVDWVCAHQANKRILDEVAHRLETAPGRMLSNVARVGNTSTASIPVLLDECFRAGQVKVGDTVVMSGLGAKGSWGGAVLRM